MHPEASKHWLLEEGVSHLNHGSFGATPRIVLAEQDRLRAELEREPVRFMVERLEGLLDESRRWLGAMVGAAAEDLVFVPNATAAVNAVVRSMDLSSGDELVVLSHGYNACLNVLRYAAERAGATVVVAGLEAFPRGPERVIEAVMSAVTARTRLVLLCHVTSPTALIVPVGTLVPMLQSRGIDVLVDGAHGPGMVEVDLDRLGAAYYTANCHKWLCAPKGSAFLHVRRDRQKGVRPHVISHGFNTRRTDRSKFMLEFDWPGTIDPTPALCIPSSIRAMAAIWSECFDPSCPRAGDGGWDAATARAWEGIRARNRALAAWGRRHVAERLGMALVTPESMHGSTATVPLPPGEGDVPVPAPYPDPLQRRLIDQRHVQVPIVHFPGWPSRLVRVSAQLYNDEGDYKRLGEGLSALL